MAKTKKLENFDPFTEKIAMSRGTLDELLSDKRALIEALTKVLEVNQVRATLGFKPWICNACNAPHPPIPGGGVQCPPKLRGGKYTGECPHHNALRLLRSFGVNLDARMG
jgi:hypothetical protein